MKNKEANAVSDIEKVKNKSTTANKEMCYVVSTLSADNTYNAYKEISEDEILRGRLPEVYLSVTIYGDFGVVKDEKNISIGKGRVTPIKKDDYEILIKRCRGFKDHIDSGYLEVVETKPKKITEATKNLNTDDKGQLLKDHYYSNKQGSTNKPKAQPIEGTESTWIQ